MSSAVVRSLRQLMAGSAMRPPCMDFERAKGGKAATKATKKGEKSGRKAHERYVKMFEAQGQKKFERPEEEKARDVEIAKEYSRRMFARHNLWSRQIMMRIKLRDAAIAALPEELQAEANEMDLSPAPRNRHVFTEYPPIKGYNQM